MPIYLEAHAWREKTGKCPTCRKLVRKLPENVTMNRNPNLEHGACRVAREGLTPEQVSEIVDGLPKGALTYEIQYALSYADAKQTRGV